MKISIMMMGARWRKRGGAGDEVNAGAIPARNLGEPVAYKGVLVTGL